MFLAIRPPAMMNGRCGGVTVGAFNLLNESGFYTPRRLARVDEVMPFASLAMAAALLAGPPPASLG